MINTETKPPFRQKQALASCQSLLTQGIPALSAFYQKQFRLQGVIYPTSQGSNYWIKESFVSSTDKNINGQYCSWVICVGEFQL